MIRSSISFLLLIALTVFFADSITGEEMISPQPGNPAVIDTSYLNRDQIVLEVLTVDPGNEIHNLWGHTGIHVYDPLIQRDLLFDYGRFRFGLDFGWRYLSGEPAYWLGVSEWTAAIRGFASENRTVSIQRIRLTEEKKREVLDYLYRNAQPKNRYYRYHHFLDNCTTRVRDLLDRASGGELRKKFENIPAGFTFRDRSIELTRSSIAVNLMLNLLLNAGADYPIDRWKAMFLPGIFQQALEYSHVTSDLPGNTDLVGPRVVLYQSTASPRKGTWWLFWIGIFLYVSFFHLLPAVQTDFPGRSWIRNTGLFSFAIPGGVTGSLLAFFWIASPMPTMAWNLNLLAFSPFLFAFPFAFSEKRSRPVRLLSLVFFLLLPFLGLFLEETGWIPQRAEGYLLFSLLLASIQGIPLIPGRKST